MFSACFLDYLYVFHDICNTLQGMLKLPGLPKTYDGLNVSTFVSKTSRYSPKALSGCLRAVDGIAMKTSKPADDLSLDAFYSYNGYYFISVEAMVNSDYMFLSSPLHELVLRTTLFHFLSKPWERISLKKGCVMIFNRRRGSLYWNETTYKTSSCLAVRRMGGCF